ncbi:MAG: hypothetical protein HC786_29575 [Richelia sp. CSU_2_1]|nr:hypothetical protein [Richelia sp. CSU_2_1]
MRGQESQPFFDSNFYAAQNPGVAEALATGFFCSGFDHFIEFGAFEERNPSPVFDNSYYLSQNPEIAAALETDELTGIEHFVEFGIDEGRASSHDFDVSNYLANNPDLVAAGFDNRQALEHFVTSGSQEGRCAVKKQGVSVLLFRGTAESESAGFLGTASGMDTLETRLKTLFAGDSEFSFNSQVFREFELQEAVDYINSFEEPRNIVLIGYSAGANTVVELVPKLPPYAVDLLIQIDPVSRPALEQIISPRKIAEQFPQLFATPGNVLGGQPLPEFIDYRTFDELISSRLTPSIEAALGGLQIINALAAADLIELVDLSKLPEQVKKGINYYQTVTNNPDIEGLRNVAGSENINVEVLFNDRTITHSIIDEYQPLLEKIAIDIAAAIPSLAD